MLAQRQAPSDWDALKSNGIAIGPADAPVTVVEFADLECPACRQFNARLKRVTGEMHASIEMVIIHYPLSIHRFATQAARALECADTQGVAARFVDVAYAKQDSFGLKAWVTYGIEAGVADTMRFEACTRDTAPIPRLAIGRRLGDALNLRGTPLVVINGWRFHQLPNDRQLRTILEALERGQAPPGA